MRVIAITSGKGGVGKTAVSVNLGIALARGGKSVMLMDADLGLANVDVLLGLQPRYNLSHVIEQRCDLGEIIVPGPSGMQIVPGASGIKKMTALQSTEHAALVHAFNDIEQDLDILLVDTSAGINETVVTFVRACQEVVVVVCDEPASITDAYALIKVLSRDYRVSHFRILANRMPSVQQGRELFEKLARVTDRFLDVVLDFMGVVPEDEYLRKAVQQQQSVIERFPSSRSAIAFRRLAKEAETWPQISYPDGHFQFFFDRLLNVHAPRGWEE
ncbi:MAG: MinD/ParA family protein [Gammaproteobacteria bacterium]|nr:MinD/ParA family protein [Gammaproteobacteria bacterium]